MNRLLLTAVLVSSLAAFAQDTAPKPAEGTPPPAPTSGAATTATPKGQGVKKVKPGTQAPKDDAQPQPQKPDDKK